VTVAQQQHKVKYLMPSKKRTCMDNKKCSESRSKTLRKQNT
jgi:hypothetical protein